MEQTNVNVQETTQNQNGGRITNKWSKGKKIAVGTGIGVGVAGIATAAFFIIRKFKKA